MTGATRREECDDGIDLVGGSRRAAEKALGSRIIGEPDRRGTRKCDAKRRDRQSASAGPVRPRQEPVLGRPAAAQGTPGATDDAGLAPGFARQHRACARLRGRDGARSDRLRQRGADEPAAVAARTERSHLPLAGRRSLEPGILLLRRQGARWPALLRASLARRVSAGLGSPSCGAEADAVRARFVVARMEPTGRANARPMTGSAKSGRFRYGLTFPGLRCAPPGLRISPTSIAGLDAVIASEAKQS